MRRLALRLRARVGRAWLCLGGSLRDRSRGARTAAPSQRIEARTGNRVSRIGTFALSVRAPDAAGLSQVTGVAWVERIRASRRLMFTPNDPLPSVSGT